MVAQTIGIYTEISALPKTTHPCISRGERVTRLGLTYEMGCSYQTILLMSKWRPTFAEDLGLCRGYDARESSYGCTQQLARVKEVNMYDRERGKRAQQSQSKGWRIPWWCFVLSAIILLVIFYGLAIGFR